MNVVILLPLVLACLTYFHVNNLLSVISSQAFTGLKPLNGLKHYMPQWYQTRSSQGLLHLFFNITARIQALRSLLWVAI